MATNLKESTPLLFQRPRSSETDDAARAWKKRRATWSLPLVILTYFLSYYMSVIILNPYIYDIVAEELNYKKNSSSQKPCIENKGNTTNTTESQIQDEIQRRVSTIELYIALPSLPCAALSILIVGPLTDKYGRKPGFFFPIVGTLLKQIVYAIVIRAELPLLVLLVGHVFECIGGSFAAMLTSMFTVISDITDPGPQRSFRITIMEALQTLTGAACSYIIGQWIIYSYFYPMICSLGFCVTSLLLTLFLLPETVHTNSLLVPRALTRSGCCCVTKDSLRRVFRSCFHMFKKSFLLFKNDQNEDNRVNKRRLCILVFILTVAVNFSVPGVQYLYLIKHPRCWPATKVLTFGSIQMICNWIAILLLMKLMHKVFKMSDRHIAMLGVISSLTSHAFMSLATNDVMVYEAVVIGVMIRAIIPMLRSIMSSVVEKTDQGAVYSILGCVEVLGAAVFGITANRVYNATLSVWDGSVFVMFAGLMVIALVCLILLNMLFSRDEERETLREQSSADGSIQDGTDSSW